jgi:tetratricopeptide (TPR) repeat protein
VTSETQQAPKPDVLSQLRRSPRRASRARGVFGVFLAVMIVSWVLAAGAFAQDTASKSDEALRVAREASDRKDFDHAAATLRRALKGDPENRELLSLLGRVLAWSRHFDESIASYRKLLARYPDDAFDRAGYARALAWSGHSNEAVPEFRRAIAQDSTDLETRIGYARALSWDGDLAGASAEFRRVIAADHRNGDAWLGLATVARWRGAPTASDVFAERAGAHGADKEGLEEERNAVRVALRPTAGAGWTGSRERQITSDSTAFKLATAGEFVDGRTTLSRSVGVEARVSRLRLWEINPGLPTDTTLNYDLRSTAFRGDLSFLRYYPVQASAGFAYERFEARNPTVLFPLGSDKDFLGFNARVWGYAGRLSPSVGAARDFIAIKTTDAGTGARVLVPGGVTNTDLGLRWDPNARVSATGSFAKSFYTDDNERTSLGGVLAYRFRRAQPRLSVDYVLTWSDFSKTSTSYFTPLQSVRHAAGVTAAGYSERGSLDYGARYEFSFMQSGNFEDISTNTGSVYLNGTVLGSLPLGVEAYGSVDNHSYRTWGLTLSGSVRW